MKIGDIVIVEVKSLLQWLTWLNKASLGSLAECCQEGLTGQLHQCQLQHIIHVEARNEKHLRLILLNPQKLQAPRNPLHAVISRKKKDSTNHHNLYANQASCQKLLFFTTRCRLACSFSSPQLFCDIIAESPHKGQITVLVYRPFITWPCVSGLMRATSAKNANCPFLQRQIAGFLRDWRPSFWQRLFPPFAAKLYMMRIPGFLRLRRQKTIPRIEAKSAYLHWNFVCKTYSSIRFSKKHKTSVKATW